MQAGIQVPSILDKMLDFETGTLDDEGVLDLFQELVNNGMAWTLQGFYGRTAQALLDAGLIEYPNKA